MTTAELLSAMVSAGQYATQDDRFEIGLHAALAKLIELGPTLEMIDLARHADPSARGYPAILTAELRALLSPLLKNEAPHDLG